MALTAKQQLFVKEYLVDLNAKQAAIRAGYSEKTAEQQASRLLSNVKVRDEIEKERSKRSERTEITADMVLKRWWDLATADPNELVQVRRVCCRYCHGIDHQYQWRNEQEYQRVVEHAIRTAQEIGEEPVFPSNAGGYGYDRSADPHPECPVCDGEGEVDVHIADTRKLKGKAKLLYAGIKQTQTGIEIRMHDQQKALENVARHLGMFTEKIEHTGNQTLQVIFDPRMSADD